jgi:hypothetical protein
MANRLRVNLVPGWSDYSDENPGGPPTFLRDASPSPGPLQVSCAWYTSGQEPNPSDDDLIGLAKRAGDSFDSPALLETGSGPCAIGRFGTAVFRCNDAPRVQAWYLTNGRDFITVTHICGDDVEAAELHEAQRIVEDLRIETADDPPMQRTGAADILSRVGKWFGRGPGR